MSNNYLMYHTHTELSLLDSTTNYKLYIDRAKKLGMKSIAFTEHGNIYNYVKKKQYCEKQGLKYIHGVEVYLTEQLAPKVRDNYHTVLLAKNIKGFYEINKLMEVATSDDHFYYNPRITFDEFLNLSDNVITTSACLASPLRRLDTSNPYYEKLAKKYDFYEIQPHEYIEQKEYNQHLLTLSKIYNKPLIAGTDTHAVNKYKAECRTILQLAKDIKFSNEDSFDLSMKTYNELVSDFKRQDVLPKEVYLQAIENTNILDNMIESYKLDDSFKYPNLYPNEEELFKYEVCASLENKIEQGILSGNSIPQYTNRIREEFDVYKELGMFSFLLFMSELIRWGWKNDIPINFNRGSVGGSFIAYLLDIIDLNSFTWGTVFSRFANKHRVSLGDIDIDYPPNSREKVFEYVINRFGMDKTAYVLTTNTAQDKGAIDEICRALKRQAEASTIKDLYSSNPDEAKEKYPEVFYYFEGIRGTITSQGVHPAGIVASPITLSDNIGVHHYDGKIVTQIDMDELHDLNYVKYDILGLKNMGILKDVCNYTNTNYPKSHLVNWNDKNVWDEMLVSNIGNFQFESDSAFEYIKQFKPRTINELSLINAGLRPSGASYRNQLFNRIPHKNPSPAIDELLKENHGYLVFQEDVIQFLTDICGLEGGKADLVRRAIADKKLEDVKKYLPEILEGYCKHSDKPKEEAEQDAQEFIQILIDSSEYMFGKNHATGYSMLGYVLMMYRHYYPLEFITALLNNAKNNADILDGHELAKIKGIEIKPIKFRYSRSGYFFNKKTNSIYEGIASIKYLNNQVAEELYQLGKNDYNDFIDFLIEVMENTSANKRQITILAKLGYFNEFGGSQKLLSIIDKFYEGKMKYDKKYTDKTKIKRINMLKSYADKLMDEEIDIRERIVSEFEYASHITALIPQLPHSYCMCVDIERKFKNPFITLVHLDDGTIETIKVRYNKFLGNKFEKYDTINIISKKLEHKWMKTANDFKMLQEKEWILKEWSIIR